MSFLTNWKRCQKCGKMYITNRFDGELCGECEKAEQEPNRDMEEIAEIMKCGADAETKCKMISNILTAKPHYFAEQEPCDTISYNDDFVTALVKISKYEDKMAKMPSVQTKAKTGHWIKKGNTLTCPFCGAKGEDIKDDYCFNYCPNCGARMVEPQEGGAV